MNTVVLAPHGASTAVELARFAGAGVLITWRGGPGGITVPEPRPWATYLQRLIGAGFAARIILRLLGADGGTQFARRLRAHAGAAGALAAADLIIAADDDAVLAAWRSTRDAGAGRRAVYGLAAGQEMLRLSGEAN